MIPPFAETPQANWSTRRRGALLEVCGVAEDGGDASRPLASPYKEARYA